MLKLKIGQSDRKFENASKIEAQLNYCMSYLTYDEKEDYYTEIRDHPDLYGENVIQS